MRKNLFIPLLLFSFGCSSGEMINEHQKNDPLVGTWDVIRIEGNENKDRVIYNPDGTWTSLISVLSDRDEIGYWVNISDSKDFNSLEQIADAKSEICLPIIHNLQSKYDLLWIIYT